MSICILHILRLIQGPQYWIRPRIYLAHVSCLWQWPKADMQGRVKAKQVLMVGSLLRTLIFQLLLPEQNPEFVLSVNLVTPYRSLFYIFAQPSFDRYPVHFLPPLGTALSVSPGRKGFWWLCMWPLPPFLLLHMYWATQCRVHQVFTD